ncbi:DUF1294 domain-containing protein [Acidovorax sp. LjRoot118]|uniref:DUF1294 domain-containing protein n=1 Tax=unclassified Acidovorax TaxID=2684926 RepID=UPI00070BF2BA|nr:DUF1294 domain-containing protein [Acidovorax sp. Root217]KRC20845.1 DNA-binding protein [Acidovorax sp. Root217]
MQKQGTVARWNAERAFGFIRSPDTDADVFFHVRDFRGGGAPREGQAVVYEEIHVGGKGPRAMAVQPVGTQAAAGTTARGKGTAPKAPQARQPSKAPAPAPRRPQRMRTNHAGSAASTGPALLLMVLWVALLAWGVWSARLPLWLLGAAAAVNLLTYVVYAMDKGAAQRGQWRVPEKNLHLLALAGGWPGAWVAQQTLRHKSSKAEFRVVYWATVVLHCAGLAAWVMRWIG